MSDDVTPEQAAALARYERCLRDFGAAREDYLEAKDRLKGVEQELRRLGITPPA